MKPSLLSLPVVVGTWVVACLSTQPGSATAEARVTSLADLLESKTVDLIHTFEKVPRAGATLIALPLTIGGGGSTRVIAILP